MQDTTYYYVYEYINFEYIFKYILQTYAHLILFLYYMTFLFLHFLKISLLCWNWDSNPTYATALFQNTICTKYNLFFIAVKIEQIVLHKRSG